MTEPTHDRRPIAIHCGRLLNVDMGALDSDRVLHVGGDGRITAVAAAGDGTADGAEVLDRSGLTVLPGLIDVHTHMVGDVQTADVPSTTTSTAEEVLIGVRHAGGAAATSSALPETSSCPRKSGSASCAASSRSASASVGS